MKSYCSESEMADGQYRPHTAFGCPRYYLGNRFVYVVVCPRARGLAIGINLNPEGKCNFRCVYCEVQRPVTIPENTLDLDVLISELEQTISLVRTHAIREHAPFNMLSEDLLRLEQVIISGDGEPTLSPFFVEAVERIVHIRALQHDAFFKLSLYTNGSGLDLEPVLNALKFFTLQDDIWVKLEAGTQNYMARVNGGEASLEHTLANIRLLGKQHPVGIQSLFPLIQDQEPPSEEIDAYIRLLSDLKNSGIVIPLVQVFSAGPTATNTGCSYLPLRSLSHICHRIKTEAGLPAEVF